MQPSLVRCVLLSAAFAFTAQANPLLGGPKTIAVGADGSVPGLVASPQMGQGGYVSGATKVAVPLIAVAFETSAEAHTSNSFMSKSLSLQLDVDDAVMKAVAAELQSMVETDLAAQGNEGKPGQLCGGRGSGRVQGRLADADPCSVEAVCAGATEKPVNARGDSGARASAPHPPENVNRTVLQILPGHRVLSSNTSQKRRPR